jgi:hypothetical protein
MYFLKKRVIYACNFLHGADLCVTKPECSNVSVWVCDVYTPD